MPCTRVGDATICTPPQGIHRRDVINCPTCHRRTPGVRVFGGVWYGSTFHCAGCLDIWGDGERYDRPFYRYWKRDRAAQLRELWDSALMPAEYERVVHDLVHDSIGYDHHSEGTS